jgi:Fic family protein
MNASKYASIANVSKATATREVEHPDEKLKGYGKI